MLRILTHREFTLSVEKFFRFLIVEFNYTLNDERNRGTVLYDVEYDNNVSAISISYENTGDYLQAILSILKNGQLPDYDDRDSTFHLESLNRRILKYLTEEDFVENKHYFCREIPLTEMEKRLKKLAMELRLCLKNIKLIKDK